MVAFGSPVVPEVNPRSATSSRPVLTASNRTGLFSATRSSSASWFEVPSKFTTCLRKRLVFAQGARPSAVGLSGGAGDQLVGDAAVGERERNFSLVDDLAQLDRAQQRHGVDDDGAGLGCREPR